MADVLQMEFAGTATRLMLFQLAGLSHCAILRVAALQTNSHSVRNNILSFGVRGTTDPQKMLSGGTVARNNAKPETRSNQNRCSSWIRTIYIRHNFSCLPYLSERASTNVARAESFQFRSLSFLAIFILQT
jgi:hypothetical protein